MHTFLGDIKSWSFFFSLPRSVPSVWSTGGPVFPVAFLPLTHWDWPTLLSSQWHVPVSNVQPSSPELVSLTINNITYIILNVWSNLLKNKNKKKHEQWNVITFTLPWCDDDIINGSESSTGSFSLDQQLSVKLKILWIIFLTLFLI